ncbi:hypothetical protein Mapa_016570 [Marchantia paleacea]|nr:hypothetical protein Mapa_016570 [Marchantia paleacea]
MMHNVLVNKLLRYKARNETSHFIFSFDSCICSILCFFSGVPKVTDLLRALIDHMTTPLIKTG